MRKHLQRLLHYRSRLSGQFSLGIGGAVALTVAASLVGWFFFDRVASVQRRVNEGSVPEMVAAFGVAQSASNLVAAAPRLTTAATREQLAGVASRITAHEIRNPLNFVKNFSEASEELIDELKEVLEEGGEKLDEEQRSGPSLRGGAEGRGQRPVGGIRATRVP